MNGEEVSTKNEQEEMEKRIQERRERITVREKVKDQPPTVERFNAYFIMYFCTQRTV